MTTRKRLLLLPGALLCASVAMAQLLPPVGTTAPTSLFQLNGYAGSPAFPGSNGVQDPNPQTTTPAGYPCYYGSGATATTCDNFNQLNGTGNTTNNGGKGTGSVDGNSTGVRTFINGTTAADTRFGNGTTDFQDTSGSVKGTSYWSYQGKASGPKTTLNAAYAVDYKAPNDDHVIIFGADRASPNGSTNIGFWLLQDTVSPIGTSGGAFTGVHKNGDILALSQLTNGGGTSVIAVYAWSSSASGPLQNTDCRTASKNTSAGVGQCAETNLVVLSLPTSTCGSAIDCVIVNGATTNSKWEGALVSPLFFEGGLNLTAVAPNSGCFANFLMETRSSPSIDAELKDFLLGTFPECHILVTKACSCSAFHTDTVLYDYDFGGTVTNDGGGPLYNVTVTDRGQSYSCVTGTTPLAKGATMYWGSATVAPNPTGTSRCDNGTNTNKFSAGANASNSASVIANVSPTSSTTTGNSFGPITCDANASACTPSPGLEVHKRCVTTLVADSSLNKVYVRVDYTGEVKNTGNVNASANVAETAPGTPATASFGPFTLTPGESKCFTNGGVTALCPTITPAPTVNQATPAFAASYVPNTFSSILSVSGGTSAGRAEFDDVVTATGTDVYGNSIPKVTVPPQPPIQDTGKCLICPYGYCPSTKDPNIN